MVDEWRDKLRQRFGFHDFHRWQRSAIKALLHDEGRALVVAPSGGGKSLCYWFPATEIEGLTLVVSPLIALMADQVRSLADHGIGSTYLASTLEENELAHRWKAIQRGDIKIVYLTPERLRQPDTLRRLSRLSPGLLAIDEAHCISQWGHDFRPDYLRLREVVRQLKPARLIACTATATVQVRHEIMQRLGLDESTTPLIMCGFARPELRLSVVQISNHQAPQAMIDGFLLDHLGDRGQPEGAALVYAITRHEAEAHAQWLIQDGWRAAAYHAGMAAEERAGVLERFMDREIDVVAATNAFGMGIDRSDIRAVVHTRAPGSLEAYYQEIGRAGRDGKDAHAMLITSPSDLGLRKKLIDYASECREAQANTAEESRTIRAWKLFTDVMAYVDAGSCRHDYILRYFGDLGETLGGCGHCDVCTALHESGGRALQSDVPADEARITVRKALSAVARARRTIGLRGVANMLAGNDTAMLRRLGLIDTTTFGLFRDYSEAWSLALLRRLIAAGLLDVTPNASPVPFLTAHGIEVMKGAADARVLLPGAIPDKPRRRARRAAPIPQNEEERALYFALKQCRWDLARKEGIPAYRVCPDRTLIEIAQGRPESLDALKHIFGMGPSRVHAWGQALLHVVEHGYKNPASPESHKKSEALR